MKSLKQQPWIKPWRADNGKLRRNVINEEALYRKEDKYEKKRKNKVEKSQVN